MLLSQQRLSLRTIDLFGIFSRPKESSVRAFIPKRNHYWIGSGREALRQIMLHLGRAGKNRVGVPAYTCQVVLEAVQRAGAKPVFYDSSVIAELEDILKVIKSIDVLLVCHNFGFMPDMAAIQQLCREHHVVLVEDCAQALGATFQGKLAGSFGDYSFFSFGISKNIGFCGGLIATDRKISLEKLPPYPFSGVLKAILEIGCGSLFFHPYLYPLTRRFLQVELQKDHPSLSYSCPRVARNIISHTLQKYKRILDRRITSARYCAKELDGLKGAVDFIRPIPQSSPAWLYFVMLGSLAWQQKLLEEGVEIGKMVTFRCFDNRYPKAKEAEQKVFTFALYCDAQQVQTIVKKIKECSGLMSYDE